MKDKGMKIFNLVMAIANFIAFAMFAFLVISTIINGENFVNLAESLIGSIAVLLFLALNVVIFFLNYWRMRK